MPLFARNVIGLVLAIAAIILLGTGFLIAVAIGRRFERERYFRRLDALRARYGPAVHALLAGCRFTGIARVNVIPGVAQTNKRSGFQPASTPFFNPAAFGVPALLTFGNEPRALDRARTFAGKNEDFTLAKRTALYNERVYLDFRAEFFNLFNRHIYDAPNGFATPLGSPFQPVGAPGCPGPFACGFGAVTSASGPRTVQFGLKITY